MKRMVEDLDTRTAREQLSAELGEPSTAYLFVERVAEDVDRTVEGTHPSAAIVEVQA